jgi:CBS domain-containing protein
VLCDPAKLFGIVKKCLRLMTDKRIRHLPVVDGDKVGDVISFGEMGNWVISCQSAAIVKSRSVPAILWLVRLDALRRPSIPS